MARNTRDTDRLASMECPDCHAECVFRFSLLLNDGSVVNLTTCTACNDHATIHVIVRLHPRLTRVGPDSLNVVRRSRQ